MTSLNTSLNTLFLIIKHICWKNSLQKISPLYSVVKPADATSCTLPIILLNCQRHRCVAANVGHKLVNFTTQCMNKYLAIYTLTAGHHLLIWGSNPWVRVKARDYTLLPQHQGYIWVQHLARGHFNVSTEGWSLNSSSTTWDTPPNCQSGSAQQASDDSLSSFSAQCGQIFVSSGYILKKLHFSGWHNMWLNKQHIKLSVCIYWRPF